MQSRALSLAIDGFQAPSRVHSLRQSALPEDVEFLLRLVSRDADAERQAVEVTGRSSIFVISAAEFFIEQVLFAPGADAYRVLGGSPEVDIQILRHHMALLFRWLHPDIAQTERRESGFLRVSAAWNQIKTPDARLLYNAEQEARHVKLNAKPHRYGGGAKRGFQKRLAMHVGQYNVKSRRHEQKKGGVLSRFLLGLFNRQPG